MNVMCGIKKDALVIWNCYCGAMPRLLVPRWGDSNPK